MYNEWSLDALYRGVEDPRLQADMSRLEAVIAEYQKAAESLERSEPRACLRRSMELQEELTVLIRRLMGYFSLRRSANSSDAEGAGYMTKIQALAASTTKASVMFEKYAGTLENLDELLDSDELLGQYRFFFQ